MDAARAGAVVVGAEQAPPAAGHEQVAEDPMAYVLVVLGRHGRLPRIGLWQHPGPPADDAGQPLRGGQVGSDHRQVNDPAPGHRRSPFACRACSDCQRRSATLIRRVSWRCLVISAWSEAMSPATRPR